MKLNSKELLSYQQFWKESKNLSQQHQIGLIILSNKLLERAKDYDGEIDNITLLYPEDCSDFSVFTDFASIMQAYVTVRDEGGAKITGWFLNHEVDVE